MAKDIPIFIFDVAVDEALGIVDDLEKSKLVLMSFIEPIRDGLSVADEIKLDNARKKLTRLDNGYWPIAEHDENGLEKSARELPSNPALFRVLSRIVPYRSVRPAFRRARLSVDFP